MGLRVIDFHTHAFPDTLAGRAMPRLEEEAGVNACLDGRVSSLRASMDRAGIDVAVVASIATRPQQFQPILAWSKSIASDRLVPFASVHPDDPQALDQVDTLAREGIRGIKLHPYYQGFLLDEERLFPLYERIQARGLVLLCHTGYDIAYERKPVADPPRIARVAETLPGLKLVASHLGAWQDWDRVEQFLVGRPVYLDVSCCHPQIPAGQALRILRRHPPDRLLFGSDSPWGDQRATLQWLLSLGLGEERTRALLFGNAARLLGLS
jgi:hypothetical protein